MQIQRLALDGQSGRLVAPKLCNSGEVHSHASACNIVSDPPHHLCPHRIEIHTIKGHSRQRRDADPPDAGFCPCTGGKWDRFHASGSFTVSYTHLTLPTSTL